ncbi:glyoxylate/hydroxypyruvate/pyruvate reductase 2KGR-like isoform X4 [Triticum dicoccoides]|uniref:glyoxylate/hydroxypyruvate/pyruvate reductase 2KGR-like isoform X4 n=2 Tax=Triticum dicoccoides TaxID=85692 RepID=UPI00188E9F89|nr:glyoxylate/hydroxypyruvate/pyruvate reductase 2KGR-like isoform X4 [Triticum dicoccoides]
MLQLLLRRNDYLEQELDLRFRLFRSWDSPSRQRLRHRCRRWQRRCRIGAAVLLRGDRPRRPPKCREHRIRVTNTPNFLTDDVAGLAISVPRKTTQADRYVRAGLWKARVTTQPPHGCRCR